MTDWRPLGWALAALGIPSTVAGTYLTGTSGEISVLLIAGLSATTISIVLREELQASSEGPDDATGESV